MKAIRLVGILEILILGMVALPGSALAQIEVLEEQSTLRGLQQIELNVQLELSRSLEELESLRFPEVQQQVRAHFKEQKVPVFLGNNMSPTGSNDYPTLLVHVNAFDAGEGLVPFNLRVALYQPAVLPLIGNMRTRAATWETNKVGLVSSDQLGVIVEALLKEIAIFSEEYQKVN
ncbi:MAG: hypothetical protein ACQETE_02180 [Bacteroidota bacterium]